MRSEGDLVVKDRRGRTITVYRIVAAVLVLLAVGHVVQGDYGAAVDRVFAAWLALVVAWVTADLRESERAQRASYDALVEAHAALGRAHADLRETFGGVTEEQMRIHFGLDGEGQR